MDRFEVPIDDHLAPLVAAAERGDEVVITKEGRVVARLASAPRVPPEPAGRTSVREALERLRAATEHLPKMTAEEAARLVRDMRDEVD